jgi:hypothetical protein
LDARRRRLANAVAAMVPTAPGTDSAAAHSWRPNT